MNRLMHHESTPDGLQHLMSEPTETEIEATLERCQHPQIGDRFEKGEVWAEVERLNESDVFIQTSTEGFSLSRKSYRNMARSSVLHGATFIPAKIMKSEEVKNMSDQEINIAIAEACGWKDVHFSECWGNVVIGTLYDDEDPNYAKIPNYCADLNAMHEAEKTLIGNGPDDETWVLWDLYRLALEEKLGYADAFAAEANQRAEAFLRTIGKWKEAE